MVFTEVRQTPNRRRISPRSARRGRVHDELPPSSLLLGSGDSRISRPLPPRVASQDGDEIKLSKADESRTAREGHGLYRTLTNNMMVGVSTGFEKKLKLVGVGYKASMQGTDLNLALGYAHPVILSPPPGIDIACTSNTEITVSGYDKVEVGNFAAIIRSKRKPEPYKGKGVRYADEYVPIKEGKRK
jgi:large subunit ribosomal protein L6